MEKYEFLKQDFKNYLMSDASTYQANGIVVVRCAGNHGFDFFFGARDIWSPEKTNGYIMPNKKFEMTAVLDKHNETLYEVDTYILNHVSKKVDGDPYRLFDSIRTFEGLSNDLRDNLKASLLSILESRHDEIMASVDTSEIACYDAESMAFHGNKPKFYCDTYRIKRSFDSAIILQYIRDPDGTVDMLTKEAWERDFKELCSSYAVYVVSTKLVENIAANPSHDMKLRMEIRDALSETEAVNVNITVEKDGQSLTFKYPKHTLTTYCTWYPTYNIPSSDRDRFMMLFGRNAELTSNDIIDITYKKKTIYTKEQVS